MRQDRIKPLLAALQDGMRVEWAGLLKHNDVGGAMDYMLKR